MQIFGVPLELLGVATADATDMTSIDGDSTDAIAFPAEGSELGAGELPSLAGLASGLPTAGLPSQGLPALPTAAPIGAQRADVPPAGSPLSGLTQLAHLAGGGLTGTPALSAVHGLPALGGGLPGRTERADVPALPKPTLPSVSAVPAVTGLSALGGALPGETERADVPATPALPTSLPQLPALGGLPVALPATPVLPTSPEQATTALPVHAKLPVLENAVPNAQVPALSGLDSTGFLAKLMNLVKRK